MNHDRTLAGSMKKAMKMGQPQDHAVLIQDYLDWREQAHYSRALLQAAAREIPAFFAWSGWRHPAAISLPDLEAYTQHLHRQPGYSGKAAPASVAHKLSQLRGFFRWLVKQGRLTMDPTASLVLPRQTQATGRQPLSRREVEALMAAPDLHTPWGLRTRTIMETLYSSGIRAGELCRLHLTDLDMAAGVLRIVAGKGRKDRYVPIGNRALHWLERYLQQVRPLLVAGDDDGLVFHCKDGSAYTPKRLSCLMHHYKRRAGIRKPGACHLFRTSMAAHMLENGADIYCLQAILGHHVLDTTGLYTQVGAETLKRVHRTSHPRGKGGLG